MNKVGEFSIGIGLRGESMWDALARKYGVELIEKDGMFIARKGSLEVTSKIVDDKVVVRVNTLPYTAVIQPTKDGVVNTVYLGVLPISQVKYRVEPQGFIDKIKCIAKGIAIILVMVITALILTIVNPGFLVEAILVLFVGTLIVILLCMAWG